MFLKPEEIIILTGYRLPAKQKQWLEANGIKHMVPASGRPLVLRKELERAMITHDKAAMERMTPQPNFSALEKIAAS